MSGYVSSADRRPVTGRGKVTRLLLTGDVNLMNVADPTVPFRQIVDEFRAADVVFSNLECCLHRPHHSVAQEGFFADPAIGGEALKFAGIHAVGIANNVNYGAAHIVASVKRLDEIGIAHTGGGADLAAARAPAIVARNGVRFGALQRSSVYWPTDHEAHEDAPGIAVIRGHTAYHVPTGRTREGIPPANRPGIPPEIITWADAAYLADFGCDIEALRARVDIVVASCHWGLGREPLQYMTEIARAAIDAGADVVIGHGPHDVLPIEIYKGRPIYYGLGNLSFDTGHRGRKHGNWLGMVAEVTFDGGTAKGAAFRFVRRNEGNETVLRRLPDEADALADLTARCKKLGTTLEPDGDRVRIVL
jgi:poly-gamma-glutamate capsule biosynthesis protein CapA/YwtB (metallophosphatase superfamily)